jgi:hypothetical protein
VMSIQYEERREAWPGGMLLDCHMLTPAAALLLLAVVLAGMPKHGKLAAVPSPRAVEAD